MCQVFLGDDIEHKVFWGIGKKFLLLSSQLKIEQT
jgi:hypothetical protein